MADIPDRAEEAVGKPTKCPRCHQVAVVFDYLQGFSVCEACGRLLENDEFVPQLFQGDDTMPSGTFVGEGDTGLGASAAAMGNAAGRALLQRYRPTEPWVKLKQHLAQVASKLNLPAAATKEAEGYLQRLQQDMPRPWRREEITAAAVYISIRQNNLPLTLLDLAKATHIGLYALGRFYHLATAALGMPTPQVQAQALLPRSLDRVLKENPTEAAGRVLEDAGAMLAWSQQQLVLGSKHPIHAVGASIMVALEMNNIAVGVDYVADALFIGPDALVLRLARMRDKLLSFSKLLPYSSLVTRMNVFCHAKAIIRLTKLLHKDDDAAAEPEPGSASAMLVAAQHAQQDEDEKEEEAQEVEEAVQPAPSKRRRVQFKEDGNKKINEAETVDMLMKEAEPPGGDVPAPKRGPQLAPRPSQPRPAPSPVLSEDDDLDNKDDDELGSDLDMSDDEIDRYLRTPAEVQAYQEVFEALTEGAVAPVRKKRAKTK